MEPTAAPAAASSNSTSTADHIRSSSLRFLDGLKRAGATAAEKAAPLASTAATGVGKFAVTAGTSMKKVAETVVDQSRQAVHRVSASGGASTSSSAPAGGPVGPRPMFSNAAPAASTVSAAPTFSSTASSSATMENIVIGDEHDSDEDVDVLRNVSGTSVGDASAGTTAATSITSPGSMGDRLKGVASTVATGTGKALSVAAVKTREGLSAAHAGITTHVAPPVTAAARAAATGIQQTGERLKPTVVSASRTVADGATQAFDTIVDGTSRLASRVTSAAQTGALRAGVASARSSLTGLVRGSGSSS